MKGFLSIILFNVIFASSGLAANRTVNLVVDYKTVNFTGKNSTSLSINNQIPAPTLHFNEGDDVTINVYNRLKEDTSIHWHGIILPWQVDGVAGITQHGIPRGGIFHYHFKLRQSGTYWYHAHAGLQEQQGLYGAFIVDPTEKPRYHFDKDFAIVLSDWSDTHPDQILANLKKSGGYYAPRFPLQSSLQKFIHDYRKASLTERKNLIDDYKMMQQMRMGLYDLSDVAYDAFLLNGQPSSKPWTGLVKVGDIVRLRFIGAAGSTIYRVKIPGCTMQMVQVDGNDIQPYSVQDFDIAPGETIDVLVKIQQQSPSIIYAESIETLGAAYGALITAPHQTVNYSAVKPFPEPLPVSRPMMDLMMEGIHHSGPMNMDMPTESSILGDRICPPKSTYLTSKGIKYHPFKAAVKTNDPNKSVDGTINMELFGYMERYIWFINGVPEYNAKPIIFKPGKRYRFVFTNNSMMRHPMHIHGHWFILRNGHGAYDPLLHTIEVAPGATITADVDTDASGQWLFHCHLLYHMMNGMARVFQYSTLLELTDGKILPENVVEKAPYINRPIVRVDDLKALIPSQVAHPMAHLMSLSKATWIDMGQDLTHNAQRITYKGLYGSDFHKLQLMLNDAEIFEGKIENADLDIFYWHPLDQFWSIKGGLNYFYRPAKTPYLQPGIGIEGLMPYFIETNLRGYYHDGSFKFDIEFMRDSQITNNFIIRTGIRSILATKTLEHDEIGSGLNELHYIIRPYYRLMPGLNVFLEYEHEHAYGAFKSIEKHDGNPASQDTLTAGVSVLL